MNTIDNIGSLLNSYASACPNNNSGNLSSLSSEEELESSLSADTAGGLLSSPAGNFSSAASSFANEIVNGLSDQASFFSGLYNDSASLTSAADALNSAAQDPPSLNYDDVSSFVAAYNSLVGDFSANAESADSGDLSALKGNIEDQEDSLSAIGITENPDGTLSIDEDMFNSSLAGSPDSVTSTLGSLASAVESSSQTMSSNALSGYSSAMQESVSLYAEMDQYEATSAFLGQLFDTKA